LFGLRDPATDRFLETRKVNERNQASVPGTDSARLCGDLLFANMEMLTFPSSEGASTRGPANPWEQILTVLAQQVPSQDFATWLRPTKGQLLQDTLFIRVPNPTYQDWIDSHYRGLIQKAVERLSLPARALELVVDGAFETQPGPPSAPTAPQPAVAAEPLRSISEPLDGKYTFARFVVGSSNQFAQAAAVQVATNPGRSYNPLFIYGGSGLGKTHLMQAIGHALRERHPNWRVVYIPAERFLNEMVQALKNNEMTTFHQRYRQVDTLLVDDIQFIGGKESTQEEFFHTFNTLYGRRLQIVLSSDRPPKEISHIEERLRSRFEWGLTVDIQPPDLETRQAILMKKAEEENFRLPEKIALFIASNVKSNIRELEGSLIRLVAYASLTGEEITEAMARRVLKDLVETEAKRLSIEIIQKAVCEFYGLRMNELKAKDNSKRVVVPRQVAMWLARELTQSSLPEIARAFGDKHHTTVLHSIAKICRQRATDKELNKTLNRLLASLDS